MTRKEMLEIANCEAGLSVFRTVKVVKRLPLTCTGWSKSLCTPDDYNRESYKWCSKCPPASL